MHTYTERDMHTYLRSAGDSAGNAGEAADALGLQVSDLVLLGHVEESKIVLRVYVCMCLCVCVCVLLGHIEEGEVGLYAGVCLGHDFIHVRTYMYVRMYVCAYVRMTVFKRTYIHTHTKKNTHKQTHTCFMGLRILYVYVRICIYVCILSEHIHVVPQGAEKSLCIHIYVFSMCVCIYIYIFYMCIYVSLCVYMYVYICMSTYT
jgi:hypothetical protein